MKQFLISTLMVVLVFSCSDSDSDSNSPTDPTGSDSESNFLMVGDNTYVLAQGLLENYGAMAETGAVNLDLTLISEGIEVDWLNQTATGSGQVFYLEMFTSTEGFLDNGVYAYNNSLEATSWDYGEYASNWTNNCDDTCFIDINQGVVSVDRDGLNYTIEFQGFTVNDAAVSLHYSGTLTYI